MYPYHTEGEYRYFMDENDKKMITWVKLFNKYDLYTKTNDKKIEEEVLTYYKTLIEKYFYNQELFF